jgi:hypothetical protein
MAQARGRRLENSRLRVSLLALLNGAAACLSSSIAGAFGQEGAFHPRILLTGGTTWSGERVTAPARWAWELVRRTSAPGRLVTGQVLADDAELLVEPLAVWAGQGAIAPLTASEVRNLRRFIELGGVLIVDDSDPGGGQFRQAAKREIARVLPESPIVELGPSGAEQAKEHVIYKSYYLLDRPVGRVEGPPFVEALIRGRTTQVIFLAHDLLGALARTPGGAWTLPCEPGGSRQRHLAIRFAVNLAMYVLCSNYKDDQVHAREIMRRRGSQRP